MNITATKVTPIWPGCVLVLALSVVITVSLVTGRGCTRVLPSPQPAIQAPVYPESTIIATFTMTDAGWRCVASDGGYTVEATNASIDKVWSSCVDQLD